MRRSIRGFVAVSGLMLAVGLGHATTARAGVAYDTGLANPPGVYFGSGNSNTHWTVNTQGGVELGLQALIRYSDGHTGYPSGAVTPQAGTGIYDVPLGLNTAHGGSLWGFAFSANVSGAGLTLSGITTQLSLVDVVNRTSGSFDALLIPDNEGYGPGGKNAAGSNASTDYGFQNAETLSFATIAAGLGDSGFNPTQNDTYLLTFSAADASGHSLGSVSETIVAGSGAPVPEPGDLAILGVGLLGLAVAHRTGRRRASAGGRISR